MKKFLVIAVSVCLTSLAWAGMAQALALTADNQCSENNAINGVDVGDVTGNSGGALDCWGTFDGNDGEDITITMDATVWTFSQLSKLDVVENGTDTITGEDIGLSITGSGGSDGTWSIDSALNVDFLIVLKAGSMPGFGVWDFSGDANDSTGGDWQVDWRNNTDGASDNPSNLSHIAIYLHQGGEEGGEEEGGGEGQEEGGTMPEPGSVLLFGTGLAGFGLWRWKKKA